jgi:hypothetical protein
MSEQQRNVIKDHGVTRMSDDNFHKIDDLEFSKELIVGADDFSMWFWGTPDKARSVYHLVESTRLPTFRIGSRIAARKSVIRAYFWAQERRAFRDQKDEDFVRLGVLLLRLSEHVRAAYDAPTAPREMQAWRLLLIETARTIDRILKSE